MTTAEEAPNKNGAGTPAAAAEAVQAARPKPKAKAKGRKRATRKPSARKGGARKPSTKGAKQAAPAAYPRHDVIRALRVPRAIFDQAAGHPCSVTEAAKLLGITASGPFTVEVSSARKYGLLEKQGGKVALTDRARRILRPQTETDEITAIREAVLAAPDISDVYNHYRGEYLPDEKFLTNALVERFGIPSDKLDEFRTILVDSLRAAKLLDESGDRPRLVDVGVDEGARPATSQGDQGSRTVLAAVDGSCFVMQPFAEPLGAYYESIFRPAIEQAGLRAVRADADIFGAGKIMDQVWRGIRSAKVLVADLSSRNPNVFYELGMAHALGKPVVLVSSNEADVPFDLHHIRVIYYDMTDPFWGQKLIDKVADNVRSALSNPEEAIYKVDDLA